MPLPLMAILAGAGLVGKIAGGAAKGSADQRAIDNNSAAQRNALLANIYGTRQGAQLNAARMGSDEQMAHAGIDMDRKKFALAAPDVRASQAVRGNLLQNIQPVSFSGLPDRVASRIPTMTGGLTPAALGPEARQMGALLARQAVMNELKGDTFEPLQRTNFQASVLPEPKLEDYQKSGLLEKILGGLGLAGSIAGGLGEAGVGKRRTYEPGDQWGYG